MPTSLTWIANTWVSCLDTAEALLRAAEPDSSAPAVDSTLAAPWADVIRQLREALDEHGVDREPFFRQAVPLAYHGSSERVLATLALRRTLGVGIHDGAIDDVATALTELRHAGQRIQPKLLDELTLRSGPLREWWESRGPGLLAGVARRTEPDLLVESCNTFVVYPIRGGGGGTHPQANSVRIEAILTNPIVELPEVVRLAWLVATLNTDLPRFVDRLASPRRQLVPLLALVPPVLEAAADVELVRPSPELLPLALRAWGLEIAEPALVAEVDRWWRTYRELSLPWPEALVALEQLLPGT